MRLDLAHIAGSTFNTPLLMHRRRLDTALAALGPRILEGAAAGRQINADKIAAAMARRQCGDIGVVRMYTGGAYLTDLGIGVLPILGTLVRRGTWLDAECGLMSYGLIRQGFDDMLADPSVRGVVAEYDTPGGEAGGCFDLARHMRAAAKAARKPLWSHANELAASAGYALASAGERIWIATTGEVGSIGVVAAHVDMSKADERAGLKWTYIFKGERKVDGNPHEPLSGAADKAVRADVSALYDMFVDLVAGHRGISAQRVRETEAGCFRGDAAVQQKLADKVGTLEDAIGALAEKIGVETSLSSQPSARRVQQAAARHPEVIAALAADRTRSAALTALGVMAAKLGVTFDASAAIAGNVGVQAARNAVLNAAAEKDEAVITCSGPGTAEQSDRTGTASTRAMWRKALQRA
ncbi:S49 family peptidase [Methylopila sp. M107]|uniref:S49 family peptidase n=1 Tax=Methylopila sp. M107 TaxID=1101190 RepID=UPI000369658C|nr:S49 family peptidase [Methylopila sp. M107]